MVDEDERGLILEGLALDLSLNRAYLGFDPVEVLRLRRGLINDAQR